MAEAAAGEDDGGGMTVVDFDMLCATVALQSQGFSAGKRPKPLPAAGEEDDEGGGGDQFGGVQRMWEGDVLDCFHDRRIAIQAACCPCYTFGKNMEKSNLGSCFLQGIVYFVFVVAVMFSVIALCVTRQHRYLYLGCCSALLAGIYLGYFRTRIRKQFNIGGNESPVDDCISHLICPCCTLCQESRTLEVNNVQCGVWHGRGDTLCLVSKHEGHMALSALQKPSSVPNRSPELCSMERTSNDSAHSWNTDAAHSEPLVA